MQLHELFVVEMVSGREKGLSIKVLSGRGREGAVVSQSRLGVRGEGLLGLSDAQHSVYIQARV